MSLINDFRSRINNQLTRSSIVSASRWACQYRKMEGDFGGDWSFKYFPWLKEMHDVTGEFNVTQKAAQMGVSETMMNIAFYQLDIPKRHVLYILPNQRPDAADFTARAFNPAIELSPHIKGMFTGGTDNVGHKTAGNANLYIRGSNSRAALKSIPAGTLIFDEFEEHNTENTKLAEERSSGQLTRLNWKVSTPFVPNRGINTIYEESTKEEFFFKCPCCSRMTYLKFPESLVITGDDAGSKDIFKSHLICCECKGVIIHERKHEIFAKNEWVPQRPGQLTRGFHISQLYSCALPPWKIAKLYLEAMKDVTAEQEFFNSKLGLAYLVAGAQISMEMFENCVKDFNMVDACRPALVTLGCDVGKKLHVWIDLWDVQDASAIDWNSKSRAKTLWAGELDSFDQLDQHMIDYNIAFAIVDAMPETRLATEFANRWYGRAKICRYNPNQAARQIFASNTEVYTSVNRTAWLDQSLGRFRNGTIFLPRNLPKDVVQHIRAPMRVPQKDSQGNLVYRYVTQDGVHDHYAHARTYSEIALQFAASGREVTTIRG